MRVAVITGAGSGLGRALSVALGNQAWCVVCTDINEDGLQETMEQVRARGGEGACHVVDVCDAPAMMALADRVYEDWGRCDLLINNAGVASTGAIGEASLEDWRWCLEIDVMGVVHGCHAFVPRMKRQGFGHVVNVASIAGFAMGQRMGPYNVAKAGVIALSETLRAEFDGTGLGVTVVCPGFFKTNIADTMRFTNARERAATEKLVGGSSISAEEMAASILKAVRRNKPYVVAPFQAKVIFWLRRLMPAQASIVIQRLLGGKRRRRSAQPSHNLKSPQNHA